VAGPRRPAVTADNPDGPALARDARRPAHTALLAGRDQPCAACFALSSAPFTLAMSRA
jgi:hypothetical protein